MVEAPRIELGSKNQRRRTLHAYSLLFLPGEPDKIRSMSSQCSDKTSTRASPTLISPTVTDRNSGPAHLSDISFRAHEQLAARRSVLIRQREPIHCYWQLCFPTRFNELHKVARHASRRSFRFLSKPVAPILRASHYKPATKMHIMSRSLCDFCAVLRHNFTSVGTHVAHLLRIEASCFGRNFTDGFKLFEILANRDNQHTS